MNEDMIIKMQLPLYSDPAYNYYYTIDRISYHFRFFYNTLIEKWIYDIRYSDGEPLVIGKILSPETSLTARYNMPFEGVLALLPIGKNKRETISNPYEIYKYYQLFYLREATESEKVSEE